ncbi:MAG: TetR/AcrR family transcriptional regulator [Clostridia bacterium]
MSKNVNNRTINALETRNKIYKSADSLFRKHGIDNVSIDSIVNYAGVSKGTFYVHFKSKLALVAELISDVVNELDLDYKSYVKSFPKNASASDILIKLVEGIAGIISDTIGFDLMKKVYEALLAGSISSEILLGSDRDLYKIFRDVIRMGIEKEEFKPDIDIDLVANHSILALRGITFEWCIRYPHFDYRDQALEHFKILLQGIKR